MVLERDTTQPACVPFIPPILMPRAAGRLPGSGWQDGSAVTAAGSAALRCALRQKGPHHLSPLLIQHIECCHRVGLHARPAGQQEHNF